MDICFTILRASVTWKIPDSVSSDVEYIHVVPEALRMNDTNADLSGASDTMVIRTLGVYRNELEEAASDISPVIRR